MARCGYCGREAGEGAAFCPDCGRPLAGKLICPECGTESGYDTSYCPRCGHTLRRGRATATRGGAAIRHALGYDRYINPAGRNFLLLLLSVMILCFSFGPVYSVNPGKLVTSVNIEVSQSAVQLIEAAFSDTGNVEAAATDELQRAYNELSPEILRKLRVGESLNKDEMKEFGKALSAINFLKLGVMDETVRESNPAGYGMLIVYAVLILAQMVVSAVFAVLALVGLFRRKSYAPYWLAYLLNFALAALLAFLFKSMELVAGSALGWGIVGVLVCSAVGVVSSVVYRLFWADTRPAAAKPLVARVAAVALSLVALCGVFGSRYTVTLLDAGANGPGGTILSAQTSKDKNETSVWGEDATKLTSAPAGAMGLLQLVSQLAALEDAPVAGNVTEIYSALKTQLQYEGSQLFRAQMWDGMNQLLFTSDMDETYPWVLTLAAFTPFLTLAAGGLAFAVLLLSLKQLATGTYGKGTASFVCMLAAFVLGVVMLIFDVLLSFMASDSAAYVFNQAKYEAPGFSVGLASGMIVWLIALSALLVLWSVLNRRPKAVYAYAMPVMPPQTEGAQQYVSAPSVDTSEATAEETPAAVPPGETPTQE